MIVGKRRIYMLLYLALILVYHTSCIEEASKLKIEEEKMLTLLTELHIAEAATQQFEMTLRDSFRQVYYQQIFEIHDVEQEVFETDMKLLRRDPMRLSKIYDKVLKELEQHKKQKERKKKEKE